MYYRMKRRAPARSKEEIAAEKEAKLARSMTCQCCARPIFAESGLIAHHGYERPWMGWQTASCIGARALPFEVSRDALGKQIASLQEALKFQRERRASLQSDPAVEIAWSYASKDGGYDSKGRAKEKLVMVSAASWPEAYAEYLSARRYRMSPEPSFAALLAREIAKVGGKIAGLSDFIAEQQARYDGWKQTHQRVGDEWVAIAA